jgi:hypothetical protein
MLMFTGAGLPISGAHSMLAAQEFQANYDEAKVPEYTLPPLLTDRHGTPIHTAEQWFSEARPAWFERVRDHVYGSWDCPECQVSTTVIEPASPALDGRAVRTQLRLTFQSPVGKRDVDLLVYLPRSASTNHPAPLFLGLNFEGNHAVSLDPEIVIPQSWMRQDGDAPAVVDHRATAAGRGSEASRWPVSMIIDAGFGLATAYYGDLAPDDPAHFHEGLPRLASQWRHGPEQPETGGAVAVWAWGLSRLLDVLSEDSRIDASRVAVIGHSRLGKTALWAGASDPRFALVVSNESGCGGAALSRRAFGETVGRINASFPHWFCARFRDYNEHEGDCPVDQHTLLALIAPRPLYVASAAEDQWADPRGEYLSLAAASEVYRLLGASGLPKVSDMPPAGSVLAADGPRSDDVSPGVFATVAYHLRPGAHDLTAWDWERYLSFARQHLIDNQPR